MVDRVVPVWLVEFSGVGGGLFPGYLWQPGVVLWVGVVFGWITLCIVAGAGAGLQS